VINLLTYNVFVYKANETLIFSTKNVPKKLSSFGVIEVDRIRYVTRKLNLVPKIQQLELLKE